MSTTLLGFSGGCVKLKKNIYIYKLKQKGYVCEFIDLCIVGIFKKIVEIMLTFSINK